MAGNYRDATVTSIKKIVKNFDILAEHSQNFENLAENSQKISKIWRKIAKNWLFITRRSTRVVRVEYRLSATTRSTCKFE